MLLKEIRERIQYLRRNVLELSQTEFGKILGVSQSVIANIEGGRLARPDQKEPLYKLICREFGVSEKWLFKGEGKIYEDEDLFARAVAEIARDDSNAQEFIIK